MHLRHASFNRCTSSVLHSRPMCQPKQQPAAGRPGVGQDINASAAARAAVASASAIKGPRMVSCDLCGVRRLVPAPLLEHTRSCTDALHCRTYKKHRCLNQSQARLHRTFWCRMVAFWPAEMFRMRWQSREPGSADAQAARRCPSLKAPACSSTWRGRRTRRR